MIQIQLQLLTSNFRFTFFI